MLRLFIFTTIFSLLESIDIYDYDDENQQHKLYAVLSQNQPSKTTENFVTILTSLDKNKKLIPRNLVPRNIHCDLFPSYALNCTVRAAKIYNYLKKTPPMPSRMSDWCMAIKSLTDCAVEWNNQCKDVTDSHFNELSIKGHMHVVSNICNDEKFLTRYDDTPECIDSTADLWESCYNKFKVSVDEHKNSSLEWTHYEVHFYLCCARARFRRCTLDTLFTKLTNCTHDQAITLQKFSVIVSEGDVYQNCDFHMMYAECPEGDPRPPRAVLKTVLDKAYNCSVIIASEKLYIFCTLLYNCCLVVWLFC